MNTLIHRNITVALLILGSAILLISCDAKKESEEQDLETLMTQQSDTLTIVTTENGKKTYLFVTPLMERYEMAKEPYMEFRKGIDITTYDSVGGVKTTLVADYAINFENQKLWEAKGNVVATNAAGQVLRTQQLFWNQKTKKVYSNVDSKVTQDDVVIVGVGFESDETFENFTFRKPKGKLLVDVSPTDSTARADSTARVGSQTAATTGPARTTPQAKGNATPKVSKPTPAPKQRAKESVRLQRREMDPKTVDTPAQPNNDSTPPSAGK